MVIEKEHKCNWIPEDICIEYKQEQVTGFYNFLLIIGKDTICYEFPINYCPYCGRDFYENVFFDRDLK